MLRWKFLLLHSRFTHPVLISLSVPFLIPWHRDMSVGRRSSLRMLECPLFKVQWRIEKFIQLSGVWRAAGGGILGRTKGEMFCMYHCSLVACPHFPPLPRLSVYCIHGELRDIALKTRLVTIRGNILSLNVKIFVKVVCIVRSQALSHYFSLYWGRRKGKLSQHSLFRAEVISFMSLKLDLIFIFWNVLCWHHNLVAALMQVSHPRYDRAEILDDASWIHF